MLSPDRTYYGIAARLDRLPDGSWQNRLSLMLGGVIFCVSFNQYRAGGLLTLWLESGQSTAEFNAIYISLSMLGYLIGTLIMGFVSDLKGRKTAILASLAITMASSLILTFVHDITVTIALATVLGVGLGGSIQSTYCILCEYTPPRNRGRYAAETGLVGNIALPVTALCVILFSDAEMWRVLYIAGFLISLVMILVIYRLFPESPRWLAVHGRYDEADRIVCEAERMFLAKGIALDKIDLEEVAYANARKPKGIHAWDLLTHPILLRRGIAVAAALFAMNLLVYYVVNWTPSVFLMSGMSSSLSIALTFVIAIGAPFGIFLLMLFADKHGRKAGLVVSLLVLAAASYGWAFAPVDRAAFTMLYGFALCSALYYYSLLACSVYIGELFPTPVRARGACFANAIGRLASIGAPLALLNAGVGMQNIQLFYAFAAVICVCAAIAIGVLGEETRYRTLEDIDSAVIG